MSAVVIAFVAPFALGLFTVALNWGVWFHRKQAKRHLALAFASGAGALMVGAVGLIYAADSHAEAVVGRVAMALAAIPSQIGFVWLAERVYGRSMRVHYAVGVGTSLAIVVASLVPGVLFGDGVVLRGTGLLGVSYVDVELTALGRIAPLLLLPGTWWFIYRTYRYAGDDEDHRAVWFTMLATGATVTSDLLVNVQWLDMPYLYGPVCTGVTIFYSALMLRHFVVTLQRVEESADLLQRAAEARARDLRETDLRLAHGARLAALGTLAAGLAHEINNPVAFIRSNLSYLEDLAKREEEDPELDEVLAETEEGVARLRGIVDELLRMSSQDGAGFGEVSLSEVVESALPTLRFEARDDVALDARLAPTPPVHGDRNLLGQVVANLVINAIQAVRAAGSGGGVRIATFADDQRAVLEVVDTGPGVAPEIAARIFEPFFTTKPAGQGTGLGLAVSAQLVERHGGRLTLEPSERGARFHVSLPLASASALGARPERSDAAREPLG